MNFASLPAKMTLEEFEPMVKQFQQILGQKHVITAPDKMDRFAGDIISDDKEDHMPSVALFPLNVKELTEIVKTCNRHSVPIWVSSTGRNIAYGGMAPVRRGTVIVSLRRMNRIIEVNPDLCYAVVEPGVTFKQLYDHIQEKQYRLMLNIPTGALTTAGPVGTTLERGIGYTSYGEFFEHQCGMEVVMPDGAILRTGMGAVPNSNNWHIYRWGYGAYLDGLFTQSNFGICTRMGLWLMPEPEEVMPFTITIEGEDALPKFIDTLRPLRISQVIPNTSVIYKGDGSGMMGASSLEKTGWSLWAALYGTKEQVKVNWSIVKKAYSKLKGVNFFTAKNFKDRRLFELKTDRMRGIVPPKPWDTWGPGNYFAPICPAEGKHAFRQIEMGREIFKRHGFEFWSAFAAGHRWLHHIMVISFRRRDNAETKRARECYLDLLNEFAAQGYGVYRTSIAFMEEVGETYGSTTQNVLRKIKKALDPNGIIAPGKSGIEI